MNENREKTSNKKAGSFYMFGTLFSKGITFLTVPVFTRLLSTSDYGIVNTYNAWVSILAIVLSYALYMSVRLAYIDYRDKVDDYMSVICTFSLLSGIILIVIISTIFFFTDNKIWLGIVVLCLLQSMATGLIEDYSMYLQMQYKYIARTVLMVLPNLVGVILSYVTIRFFLNEKMFLGRIIPTAISIIAFGFLVVVCIYKRSYVLYNKEYIRYGLSISAPLILHGIALSVLSQSDRMMITWLADPSQTGIYSLIYNYGMAAAVITTGLQGVWDPWLLYKMKEKDYSIINNKAKDYCKLITTAMVLIILLGPEIVHVLADESYWTGIVIIPAVVIANYIIYIYTFYVNVEHNLKRTAQITTNTLVAAIINIILNSIFIPQYGYIAAAYTTVASYIVSMGLHMRNSRKLVNELFPPKMFFLPIAELVIVSVAYYLLIDNTLARWIIGFGILIIEVLLEKKKIVEFIKQ